MILEMVLLGGVANFTKCHLLKCGFGGLPVGISGRKVVAHAGTHELDRFASKLGAAHLILEMVLLELLYMGK